MSETMYLVGALCRKNKVNFLGEPREINMSWATDMVGAMPVFNTKEAAETYADGKHPIYEMESK